MKEVLTLQRKNCLPCGEKTRYRAAVKSAYRAQRCSAYQHTNSGDGRDLGGSRAVEFFSGHSDLRHRSEAVVASVSALHLYRPGKFTRSGGEIIRQHCECAEFSDQTDAYLNPHDGIGDRGFADSVHLSDFPALFCERNHDRCRFRISRRRQGTVISTPSTRNFGRALAAAPRSGGRVTGREAGKPPEAWIRGRIESDIRNWFL